MSTDVHFRGTRQFSEGDVPNRGSNPRGDATALWRARSDAKADILRTLLRHGVARSTDVQSVMTVARHLRRTPAPPAPRVSATAEAGRHRQRLPPNHSADGPPSYIRQPDPYLGPVGWNKVGGVVACPTFFIQKARNTNTTLLTSSVSQQPSRHFWSRVLWSLFPTSMRLE